MHDWNHVIVQETRPFNRALCIALSWNIEAEANGPSGMWLHRGLTAVQAALEQHPNNLSSNSLDESKKSFELPELIKRFHASPTPFLSRYLMTLPGFRSDQTTPSNSTVDQHSYVLMSIGALTGQTAQPELLFDLVWKACEALCRHAPLHDASFAQSHESISALARCLDERQIIGIESAPSNPSMPISGMHRL